MKLIRKMSCGQESTYQTTNNWFPIKNTACVYLFKLMWSPQTMIVICMFTAHDQDDKSLLKITRNHIQMIEAKHRCNPVCCESSKLSITTHSLTAVSRQDRNILIHTMYMLAQTNTGGCDRNAAKTGTKLGEQES